MRLRSIKIQQVCRSSSTNRSPRKASLSPTADKPTWIFFNTAVNSSVCNFSSDLGRSFSVPVAFNSAAKDTTCSQRCTCTKEWILSSHITWLRQEKHYSVSFLVMTNVIIIIIIIYSLTARVVGAPQMISQPDSSIFLCSPLPSETWRTPGLSIPWCCLPISCSICLVFFPLSLCLQDGFGQTWWTGTCPYHCSLRLFTIVRRSSSGPIACWILARTSSLVTWSLYEMRSILR